MDAARVLKIYETGNPLDAQLLCDRMRDSSIEVEIHGLFLAGAVGELPADTGITLWLHDAGDESRARDVISSFESERREQRLHKQTCPQCDELIEGNFQVCWNCGNSLSR
ncbi:MAG: DUF2007 domain-containing protein [Pseudomonadota bacterium]